MTSMNKSRRPKSAKSTISLDKFLNQTSRDGAISQDLLIAKYLEDLSVNKKKTGGKGKQNTSNTLPVKSPYASSFLLSGDNISDVSSHVSSRKSFTKFLQPRPPSGKKKRPVSAPVYKYGTGSWTNLDDFSDSFSASMISSSSSSFRRSFKPVYKRKHHVLCVQAFPNGSRETSVRVTAQDLSQLLIQCTGKLDLPSAARKLFLADGRPVYDAKQLSKDCEVYVSTGEPFKNPFLTLQEREKLRKTSFWTMNGIVVPQNNRKIKKNSSSLSNRVADLVDSQRKRILVFKNGESFGGVEVVANRFDEFLDDCTVKLNLTSGARTLHDWSGKAVQAFSQVPCLAKVLQPSSGIVMGPLWVTKGEMFSPKGAHDFLSTMVTNTKERIRACRQNIEVLENQLHSDNSDGLFNEIELGGRIDEELTTLELLEAALPDLESNLKKADRLFKKEESMNGSAYKFKNITEIDSNSRLLGVQGVKVLLFQNGSGTNVDPVKMFLNIDYLTKGVKSKDESLQRFFDTMNSNDSLANTFGFNKGKKVYFKRAFKQDGTEIDDVMSLESNERIWLSLGDGFIPVHYDIVSLNIEKVLKFDLWNQKEIIQRDMWLGGDESHSNSKQWIPVSTLPNECQMREMKAEMTDEQKLSYYKQCVDNRLPTDVTYLQSKENHSLVLYPEVVMVTKGDESDGDVWGSRMQQWSFSEEGLIFSRHSKHLVLGILDQQIHMILSDQGEEELLDGAIVNLLVRNDAPQQSSVWAFTDDGYIQSAANPGYVLTAVKGFEVSTKLPSMANQEDEEERPDLEKRASQSSQLTWAIMNDTNDSQNIVVTDNHSDTEDFDNNVDETNETITTDMEADLISSNKPGEQAVLDPPEEKAPINPFEDLEDVYGGQRITLVVLPRFPEKHTLAATQRISIRAKNIIINVISNCDVLKEKGYFTRRYNVKNQVCEGFLTYGVPKLKWKVMKTKDDIFKAAVTDAPAKLLVLKNGEMDERRAVTVVGPDVKSMKKDVSTSGKNGRMSVSDVEFYQFLERCTSALNLPFAARRLFTVAGKEVFTLNDFKKNELVYVSCGEQWSNPTVSQSENQKRLLLANLTSDVTKMKDYVMLKQQTGFIVSVEDFDLSHGKSLILIHEPCEENQNNEEEEGVVGDNQPQNITDEKISEIFEAESRGTQKEQMESQLTAHQRSHAREKEKLPPYKDINATSSSQELYEEELSRSISSQQTYQQQQQQHKQQQQQQALSPNKWQYNDEFIHLQDNPNLVMGISSQEANKSSEIILCHKNLEDPNQRWILSTDGSICLKGDPHNVITVSTPSLEHRSQYGYRSAKLMMSTRKLYVNGTSNQVFFMHQKNGFLYPFATDEINTEITAAMKAGVCTYAIYGNTPVYQPVTLAFNDIRWRNQIFSYKYSLVCFFSTGKEGFFATKRDAEGKLTTLHFCDACGKTMRGKMKLQTVSDNKQFTCVMGEAKKNKIKMHGAFSYLNGQVDLSKQECEATVALWDIQLKRLRDESSVRTVANELSMFQNNPAVRLMVHRNGDARNEGCIVIGNVISQIFDMCTIKLNLPKAARRLYTIDGELITNMSELLKPYYPELTYMKQQKQPPNADLIEANSGIEATHEESLVIEKLDVRIPIDVWVSMGEAFIPLDEVEKAEILMKYEQNEKQDASTALEMEKHRLRQEKGRRISGMHSNRGIKPVLMKQMLRQHQNEEKIEESISQLQHQLAEVKSQQEIRAKTLKVKRPTSAKLDTKQKAMKLYQLPQAMKFYVFANGDDQERADVVFAQSINQLLDNATSKLGLSKCARRIFTVEGKEEKGTSQDVYVKNQVFSMEKLQRNQTLCVTSGDKFLPHKARQTQVELKATWARENRRLKNDMNKTSEYNGLNKSSPGSPIRSKSPSIHYHQIEDASQRLTGLRPWRPKSAKIES